MPEFPLRLASPEAFATVNRFLREVGYSEQFLLERFSLPNLHFLLYPLGRQGEEFRQRYQGPGVTALTSRLLMGGFAHTRAEIQEHLPRQVFDAFIALGLLREADDGSGRLCCPALLYPALGFFVTADRGFYLEGWPGYRGSDYVMSGTEHICRDYIESLPDSRCERALEIGTGSALAALLTSRCAGHVWATDITARAAACAEFNRRLNLVPNMTVLQGDLFEPVEGLQFDRITSNPPFEPPLKQALIFSVGGEDGEQIMRRLVAAAPRFLAPGGRLYMQALGTEREDSSFDSRVRGWLGESAGECDLALFVRKTMEPREYAIQQILGENADSWKLEEWNLFYKKLRAGSVVHGHIIVQRRESDRPVFHTTRKFGPKSGMAEMEWLMDWETRAAAPEFATRALASRPVAGDGWELHVRHKLRDGKLAPVSYALEIGHPFQVETQVRQWIAAMLARCNGSHTGGELLDWVRSNGELTGESGEAEFIRTLGALASCRFVRLHGE